MKLTKSILREMIKDVLSEADIMDKEIKNPKTGNMIKVKTALQLPDEHPTNKKAKQMVAKTPTKKSVGGEKAKGKPDSISASDWKKMDADEREYHTSGQYDKDAERDDTGKDDEPYTDDDENHGGGFSSGFSIDKVMSKKIGKDTVGDILDNPKHPNYDKAEKYALQFNPDDEKVVSGGGPKVKGPKPDGDWDNEQVMNATIGGEKVSDIFNDEEHPDYDKALNYIMSFDPDDEKVVSGGGSKKESITSKIKKEFKQYDNINKNLTRG